MTTDDRIKPTYLTSLARLIEREDPEEFKSAAANALRELQSSINAIRHSAESRVSQIEKEVNAINSLLLAYGLVDPPSDGNDREIVERYFTPQRQMLPKDVLSRLGSIDSNERGPVIREAARTLKARGVSLISTEFVEEVLDEFNIDLGVGRPRSVIGTVLSRSLDWRRVAQDQFQWQGD